MNYIQVTKENIEKEHIRIPTGKGMSCIIPRNARLTRNTFRS